MSPWQGQPPSSSEGLVRLASRLHPHGNAVRWQDIAPSRAREQAERYLLLHRGSSCVLLSQLSRHWQRLWGLLSEVFRSFRRGVGAELVWML